MHELREQFVAVLPETQTMPGIVAAVRGSAGIGGCGTLPITADVGPSQAGLGAILISNSGLSPAQVKFWKSSIGKPTPQHAEFSVPGGQSVVKAVPADGFDTLVFWGYGTGAELYVTPGHIRQVVDMGPVTNAMPAAPGS